MVTLMLADLLRDVRQRNGLSVRAMARLAGVSPATIDRLEHERVAPLRSVDQILGAVGCRAVIDAERIDEAPLTREDQRSLAFHRLVAKRLLEDPGAVRTKALHNIDVMEAAHSDGSAAPYFTDWRALLDGPESTLIEVLLSTSDRARALRQVTPFAGVLTDEERATVYSRRRSA